MKFLESFRHLHKGILVLSLILIAIGLILMYSVGSTPCNPLESCQIHPGSFHPWFMAQALKIGVGVLVAIIILLIPFTFWIWSAYFWYAVTFTLVIFVTFLGKVGNLGDAQRWISIAGFIVQPSEFIRVGIVLALTKYFTSTTVGDSQNRWFVPSIIVALPMIFILKQPDLGTSMLCAGIMLGMFYAAGVPIRWFKRVGLIALVALPVIWFAGLHEYQRSRILVFMNPTEDTRGSGYHILQSQIAIGAGQWSGEGFLKGTQTNKNFLPAKQTDFIFTVFLEQFGFLGGLFLLTLYALLTAIILHTSRLMKNYFGALMTYGLGINFFLSSFLNMGMVIGILPVVGKPLPFLSYGGSSILAMMASMALILSAHKYRQSNL